MGFPDSSVGKRTHLQCRRPRPLTRTFCNVWRHCGVSQLCVEVTGTQWVGTRAAAEQPTRPRAAPQQGITWPQRSSMSRLRNCSTPTSPPLQGASSQPSLVKISRVPCLHHKRPVCPITRQGGNTGLRKFKSLSLSQNILFSRSIVSDSL